MNKKMNQKMNKNAKFWQMNKNAKFWQMNKNAKFWQMNKNAKFWHSLKVTPGCLILLIKLNTGAIL